MKITIKISPEILHCLNHHLEEISIMPAHTHDKKFHKSMAMELKQTIGRMCMRYCYNPNGKPRTLTLKYHVATSLYNMITLIMSKSNHGIYELSQLDQLKNNLHQQLL